MQFSSKRAAPPAAELTGMKDADLRKLIESRNDDRAWATLCELVVQLRARLDALERKPK